MPAGAGSPRIARWAAGRDARRPAARHAALSLAGLRPHPTYCTQRGSSPPRGVPRPTSATAAGPCAARHAPRCSTNATTAASPLAAGLQTRNAAVPSHQGVTFSLNSYGDIFTGQRHIARPSAPPYIGAAAPGTPVPSGSLIWGLIFCPRSLAVEGQALVQDLAGFRNLSALEKLEHSPARRQIDDRRVDVGVVEAAELQQDSIDSAQVSEVGLGFTEELDRVIVAAPELQSPALARLFAAFAVRLNHSHPPQPRAVAGSVSNRPSPV